MNNTTANPMQAALQSMSNFSLGQPAESEDRQLQKLNDGYKSANTLSTSMLNAPMQMFHSQIMQDSQKGLASTLQVKRKKI